MAKMKPFCTKCGRVFEHGKVIEGKFCVQCGKFRPFEDFTSLHGMCVHCKREKRERSLVKRAAYFHDYYERVTKPKRQERSPYRIRTNELETKIDDMQKQEKALAKERKRRITG